MEIRWIEVGGWQLASLSKWVVLLETTCCPEWNEFITEEFKQTHSKLQHFTVYTNGIAYQKLLNGPW
jgi:hypothetical protein